MMIAECCYRYDLKIESFTNLFTKSVDIAILNSLGNSAADGNLDCIDMLHNLALRDDEAGTIAESILFDLFSGKTVGKMGIDEEIQRCCFKLYETVSEAKAKSKGIGDINKFHSPSKLLFIAGSAITDLTKKQDLSAIFIGKATPQSQYEQIDDFDLWCNNRMLSTDEINASIRSLIIDANHLSLNFPIELIRPEDNKNLLSELIDEKNKSLTGLTDYIEVFPLNTGGHWILLAVYHSESERRCAVFNSNHKMNPYTIEQLISSAKTAGVEKENIIFIDGDMQKNVPNGCGIFVVKAAESLSKNPDAPPADVFNNFIVDFSRLSEQEQMLFNVQNRRQLYAHSIERAL
ncbi:ElaD/SseL family deubiquitinase [Enterobacter cloacae]|uniref:ElaD/SseL family deubiquitinase n=1 Tax=Enterobacter cloacae TaxID=550 RepID=UPI002FFB4EAD